MQNIWLTQPLIPRGPAHEAEDVVLKYAIPAARKAGIQVVWLNWGLSEEDLKNLNPCTERIFTFHQDGYVTLDKGFGYNIRLVKLENGEIVEAGRFLMQNQWNSALDRLMEVAYQEGLKTSHPDRKFNKNRISSMCEAKTDCTDFFKQAGITTLLFAGCDTDVCVAATLQDAILKDFD